MPDGNNGGAGNGDANNNNAGNGNGTDPKKTDAQNQGTFDPSKVGDEDLAKVFDDPRLWKHPRFKSLNDRAKVADRLEKEKGDAEKKRLEEEGKWKELADLKTKEAEEAKTQAQTARIDNKLQVSAAKVGVVDLEAVLKLIDRTNIKVDDNGEIQGVDEAVKALLESKPYLKGDGSVTLGGGTNPGDGNKGAKRFKLSQLQDPKFYQENYKDIQEAQVKGLIEDDVSQRR